MTTTTPGRRTAGFMGTKVIPSPDLAVIIGPEPRVRTEVTKAVWAYIKEHGLQDKANRRMINADEKLLAVFGGRAQVSMFELTRLVSNQLSKHAD